MALLVSCEVLQTLQTESMFFGLLIVLDVLIAAPAAPGMEFLEQTEGTKPWYPAEHQ